MNLSADKNHPKLRLGKETLKNLRVRTSLQAGADTRSCFSVIPGRCVDPNQPQ